MFDSIIFNSKRTALSVSCSHPVRLWLTTFPAKRVRQEIKENNSAIDSIIIGK
jgi:hypothetical protein